MDIDFDTYLSVQDERDKLRDKVDSLEQQLLFTSDELGTVKQHHNDHHAGRAHGGNTENASLRQRVQELEAYTNKLETAGQEVVRRGMRMKEKRTARTIGEFIKAFDYWGQVIYAGVEQAAIKGDELASEVKG